MCEFKIYNLFYYLRDSVCKIISDYSQKYASIYVDSAVLWNQKFKFKTKQKNKIHYIS